MKKEALFSIETDKIYLSWSKARAGEPHSLLSPIPVPGCLKIKALRPDVKFEEIWRAGCPTEASKLPELQIGPRLYEQSDYYVFMRAKEKGSTVGIYHRDPLIESRFNIEDNGNILHGFINFGSQAGKSEFFVRVDDVDQFAFEVEVFPTKLNYASDYLQMISEVQEILTGLALEYLSSTYQLGIGTQMPQPSHIEWLLLLKNIVDELERGLLHIARQPVRSITRETVVRPAEKIKRVDSSLRSAIRRGTGAGEFITLKSGIRTRARLPERTSRVTLDTPEHRWLSAQINRILQRLGNLRKDEAKRSTTEEPTQRKERVLAELDSLKEKIAPLTRLEPLAAAQGDPPAGFASLQLLSAPGYHEAYRACLVLNLGLRIDGEPLHLSVKDLDVLYEYWCYLALLRLISEATGKRIETHNMFAVKQNGLHVTLRKGRESKQEFQAPGNRKISVTYNRRFKGISTLIPQQPDIVISIEDPNWSPVLLLVDAKYRIDASPKTVDRYGCAGPPEDAINRMHRYRDAILEESEIGYENRHKSRRIVVEGVIAFPLDGISVDEYKQCSLSKSLDSIGIGAIPFLPTAQEHFSEWIRMILARGGWELAERVIPHQAERNLIEWRKAAAEPVLVGSLRGANPAEHLDWIKQNQIYYIKLSNNQPRQFAACAVALYLPAALRKPGAVEYYAEVQGIDVVPRSAIHTPWLTRRRQDELVVKYRLSKFQRTRRPILNIGESGKSYRFGSHRWTSRLALERASVLQELMLETEPEWRLYEDLLAAGVGFTVSPDRIALLDPDNPKGRVWFVCKNNLRVRYAGPSGFEVRSLGGRVKYCSDVGKVVSLLKAILLDKGS